MMSATKKAAKLLQWVTKYSRETTTTLVARLNLPRDYAHCVAIDMIRGSDAKAAQTTALAIADEITDESIFARVGEPHLRTQP